MEYNDYPYGISIKHEIFTWEIDLSKSEPNQFIPLYKASLTLLNVIHFDFQVYCKVIVKNNSGIDVGSFSVGATYGKTILKLSEKEIKPLLVDLLTFCI